VTQGSISFDRIADRYDDTRGGLGRGRRVAEVINPHLGEAELVLEVGVGTGAVAFALAELGRAMIGVDLSLEMLEKAAGRLGPLVVRGDAHVLPFASERLSAAYLVWVLHLVADAGRVVGECGRILRDAGRLVVVSGLARPDPKTSNDIVPIAAPLNDLRNDRLPSDDADSVLAWCSAADLTLVTRTEREEVFEQSPEEVALTIERRSFSYLWDIDEGVWSSVVVPVIDDLRALPDPDRARTFRQYQDVLVFEK
jgi:SAM-dependent methyltransferase